MSDLKQAFRFYFMVLRSQLWALFPLAAGICLGLFSARQLAGYAVRMGAPLPAAEGFAFLMEGRSLFGLAGGVWACVFLCAGFDCRGINALLTRGYRRRWVFLAEYSWFLLGCMLCSLAAQLTAVLGAGLDCSGLGAAYLARSFALRLVLDIGFMSPPLLFAFGLRRTLPALCLSALYGLALYIGHTPQYGLWLYAAGAFPLRALWPAAALAIAPAAAFCLFRRANLP